MLYICTGTVWITSLKRLKIHSQLNLCSVKYDLRSPSPAWAWRIKCNLKGLVSPRSIIVVTAWKTDFFLTRSKAISNPRLCMAYFFLIFIFKLIKSCISKSSGVPPRGSLKRTIRDKSFATIAATFAIVMKFKAWLIHLSPSGDRPPLPLEIFSLSPLRFKSLLTRIIVFEVSRLAPEMGHVLLLYFASAFCLCSCF